MVMNLKRIPKNYNDENFKYIKNFIKINLTDICSKFGYTRSAIAGGFGSVEQYQIIRKEIEQRIAKLYLNDEEL